MKKTIRSDSEYTYFFFNIVCQEDFYASKDVEAIFEVIFEEIWDEDARFMAEVDELKRKLEAKPPKYGF